MGVLKAVHDKQDEIPEEYRPLYTEKSGKWELTGIEGIKTQADIDRLEASLKKERKEHKETKEKLTAWGDLDPEDVQEKLEKYPELEAASKGKLDEAKIEEAVNRRVESTIKSRLSPVERENKQLKDQLKTLGDETTVLRESARSRKLQDAIGKYLTDSKALPTAYEDAYLLAERHFEHTEDGRIITKDQVGVTPGMDPKSWVEDMRERKPHWWPANVSGGARGSGGGGAGFSGRNPFSHEDWNLTEQGNVVRNQGREKADRMAQAAGTTVGGPRPVPKK